MQPVHSAVPLCRTETLEHRLSAGWSEQCRRWERVTLVDLPLEVAVPSFRVILALSLPEWQLRCRYTVTVHLAVPVSQ